MEPAPNLEREQRLDEILFAYLRAVEAGTAPTPVELLARHPDLADDLRDFFTAQAEFDALAAPLRAVRDSTPTDFDGTRDDTPRPGVRPAPWSLPAPPDGDYELLEELGRGGMGVVYKARQVRLNRVVALKLLRSNPLTSAELWARFQREAEAIARLQHPHIIQVFDCGAWADQPYLVIEFVAGGSLAAQLQGRPRPPREAAALVETLARAISAVHAAGIIHRDLKPSNVLLTADGTPKVADFGLAKLLGTTEQSGGTPATAAGAILGTAAYMAPEQADGHSAEVGPAVDVYSLGAILYELLTGRPPFRGNSPLDTLRQVLWQELVPPRQLQPAVPGELEAICLKCLEKKPQHRYPSAQELADALDAWMADQTMADKPIAVRTARVSLPRPRRWVRGVVAMILLVGLLGAGMGAVLLFPFERGTFVIETDDPDFSFQVSKEGGVALHDRKTNRTYRLKVLHREEGAFDLEVTDQDADLVVKAKALTIKRGDKVVLKARLERKQVPAGQAAAVTDAWIREAKALNTKKQAEAVVSKLKELNPGFDGKIRGRIDAEMVLAPTHVTNLSPLRVLQDLRCLVCRGSKDCPGKLADLSPLKDLKLTELQCDYTNVADLSPLRDNMALTYLRCDHTNVRHLTPLKNLKLTYLWCGATRVSDLAPLQGLKLTYLDCSYTGVSDLAPLKNMKLTFLACGDTMVSDLAPLRGMPLSYLDCTSTGISDLAPLKGMPLTAFQCAGTEVSDLSPLKDMRLTLLRCEQTKVRDLSLLRGMPLKELYCDFQPERDTEILRSIPTLETINYKPAKEFWKEVDAKRP